MKVKRIILFGLILVLLGIIFVFSNENGIKSNATSDAFTEKVIDTISKEEINPKEKESIILNTRMLVRKTAHFTLYFSLGVLIMLLLHTYQVKHLLCLSLLICIILACGDEFHQLFTIGRTAQVSDVIIDSIGSACGILIVNIYYNIQKAIKK